MATLMNIPFLAAFNMMRYCCQGWRSSSLGVHQYNKQLLLALVCGVCESLWSSKDPA